MGFSRAPREHRHTPLMEQVRFWADFHACHPSKTHLAHPADFSGVRYFWRSTCTVHSNGHALSRSWRTWRTSVGSFECALPRSTTLWLRWQHDEHEAGVVAVLHSPAQCTLLAAQNLATFADRTIFAGTRRSAACHQDASERLLAFNSTLLADNSCIACFIVDVR